MQSSMLEAVGPGGELLADGSVTHCCLGFFYPFFFLSSFLFLLASPGGLVQAGIHCSASAEELIVCTPHASTLWSTLNYFFKLVEHVLKLFLT